MEFGLDRRAQALQGLAFPLQEEAKRALQQLKQKRINYIQLVSHDHEHSLLLLTVYSSNQGDRRLWERLQIPSDAAKTLQWSERHKTTFPYIWFGSLRFFQVQNPVVKVRPQPEFWHCVCLFLWRHRGWMWRRRLLSWFTPNQQRPTSFPSGFPKILLGTTSSSSNIPIRASSRRLWVSTVSDVHWLGLVPSWSAMFLSSQMNKETTGGWMDNHQSSKSFKYWKYLQKITIW